MYHALEQYETDSYQETQSAEMMYWIGREQAAKTAPTEITLMQFMDALSVMPPLDWQGNNNTESFKLQEMVMGNVTDIFVKVDGRYFTFRDVLTLSHAQIISRVRCAGLLAQQWKKQAFACLIRALMKFLRKNSRQSSTQRRNSDELNNHGIRCQSCKAPNARRVKTSGHASRYRD
ncbi:hypothetical protein RHA65_19335 [Providencia rettgeri]|nr:hypothetical protein [Providencia rettgeri]